MCGCRNSRSKTYKNHHYIEADIVFQGATRQTYIHIISGLKDEQVLLLGTDITCPKSRHGWVRREAKAKQANGLFRSIDREGNKVYVTHTFPKESVALAVAKTHCSGNHDSFISSSSPGNIWPEMTAPKSTSHALKNQLWTVTPLKGTT
jgi:hypothetical protein